MPSSAPRSSKSFALRDRPALLIAALLLLTCGSVAQGKLVILGDEKAAAPSTVKHPGAPLFRTDDRGWPIVSDAGYVALADEGPGFVYWTWLLERIGRGGKPIDLEDYGKENWAQIETLASLAKVVRTYRKRHPVGPRLRIGHLSGRHGGFPDLRGTGYSLHLSHQTGFHVDLMLVPESPRTAATSVDLQGKGPWNREGTWEVMDLACQTGGYYLFTNAGVIGNLFHDPRLRAPYPTLKSYGQKAVGGSEYMNYYGRKDGSKVFRLMQLRDHADHVNVCFKPTE